MRGVKETNRSKDLAMQPGTSERPHLNNNFACYRLNLTDSAEPGDLDAVRRPSPRPPKFISDFDNLSIF